MNARNGVHVVRLDDTGITRAVVPLAKANDAKVAVAGDRVIALDPDFVSFSASDAKGIVEQLQLSDPLVPQLLRWVNPERHRAVG